MELREGDIFRWRYRDPATDSRPYGDYHCCSRIAIVTRGRLRDTYWASDCSGRSFGPDDLHKLELERLGNLSELEKTSEWKADYYDDADILNLNHSNSTRGNFYLRKGAARSAAKMLASAHTKLAQAWADKKMAEWRAEQLTAAIAKINAGDTDTHL